MIAGATCPMLARASGAGHMILISCLISTAGARSTPQFDELNDRGTTESHNSTEAGSDYDER